MSKQSSAQPGWRLSTTNTAQKLFQFIFPALAVASLAGFFSGYGWLFNVCSHFPVQFFFAFAPGLMWFLKKRKIAESSVCALFMLLNLAKVIPYLIPASKPDSTAADASTIRLMQMNVFLHNHDFARISSSISEQSPDLIAIEEFNDRIFTGLKAHHALDKYPYSIVAPNTSFNSQIALFSKLPIKNYLIESASAHGDTSIVAHLEMSPGKELTVIVMHPRPPLTPKYLDRQSNQFEFVANRRPQYGQNVLVIGDLNTSPWAVPFKKFIKKMGVVDTRFGHGVIPTWPFFAPALSIPIDHILASPNIQIHTIKAGSFTGSDHLPLVMECSM